MTLPTGCIWIEEHLERPPPPNHHQRPTSLWSNGLARCGGVDCQGRWYVGWIQAGHEMCMGSDVGDGSAQTCFGSRSARWSYLLSDGV